MQSFDNEHIELLKRKFHVHADKFLSDDKICNAHIELKREHTLRVCDEIVFIANRLGFDKTKINSAFVIALFHDIGRFEQFSKYHTFDDSRSVDHAELSVETIKSDGFLDHIPKDQQKLIFEAILNHNKPDTGFLNDDETALFSKLLRDADKLDIWNVITTEQLRKVIEHGKPVDFYNIPDRIYQRYLNRQIVLLDMVSSDNDMRLLRISWVFDINFRFTFCEIISRKVLDKIFDLIPESERKKAIKEIVDSYIEEKVRF